MKEAKIKEFLKELIPIIPSFKKKFNLRNNLHKGQKLSLYQFHALLFIHGNGKAGMGELAEFLGVSNQQLTRIMDGLVENKIVVREPDPTNRRVVIAKISEEGMNILHEHMRSKHEEMCCTLSALSENDLDDAIHHIRSLKAIFDKVL